MRSLFWIVFGAAFSVFDCTFAQRLSVFGVAPSLLFLTLILATLLENIRVGIIVAVVLGLIADSLTGSYFGTKTVAFVAIALAIDFLKRNTVEHSPALKILAVVASTAISTVSVIVFSNYYGDNINYLIIRWYLPFLLYTACLLPVFFWLMNKIHNIYVKYFD